MIICSSVANYYYVDIGETNVGKDNEGEKGKALKLYGRSNQRAYK